MNLADHLRPLLRDHDCVIIPDFGGLVAEYAPAQVRPGGRHLLLPPSRQVAFNQALTRNDGLLVDALRQHLGLSAAAAREAVRQAVASLRHDLQVRQRTELPGIGVWRQQPGRGLQFDYTGATNQLPGAFGLPELTAHPVRTTDARLAREQQAQLTPRLRSATRGLRLRRLLPGTAIGLLAGVAVAALYLLGQHPEALPEAWRGRLPRFEQPSTRPAAQQATLAQPTFSQPAPATLDGALAARPAAMPTKTPAAATSAASIAAPATTAPAATVATPKAAAPVAAATSAATQTAALAKPRQPKQDDPVAALLAKPAKQVPPAKKGKVPPAAAIALGSGDNVARPIPLAQRKAALPANMTTSYAAVTSPKPMVPAPAPTPKPAAPATVAATTATTIKKRTGRFYVIVAAYNSLAHAEQGRRNLAHAGRPAKVILPPTGSRLYRLSAADFADRPTAQLTADKLRHNPHFDKGISVLPY